MDRTCELCGHRNEENCNSCPDMEKPKVTQIRGTAYPMNEFFWKRKHPQHWAALQKIKELVVSMTQGEVTAHFRYPEAKKPKIINKENEKDETQGQNT